MHFEELDETTRGHMMRAFEEDEAAGVVWSRLLNGHGLAIYAQLMREAIRHGDETTLEAGLMDPSLWKAHDSGGKRAPFEASSRRLAVTEFGTMYTRGLCRRLEAEGETRCVIYRAGPAAEPRCECTALEGKAVAIGELLANHRRYNGPGLRVPSGPSCHHSVRRAPGL